MKINRIINSKSSLFSDLYTGAIFYDEGHIIYMKIPSLKNDEDCFVNAIMLHNYISVFIPENKDVWLTDYKMSVMLRWYMTWIPCFKCKEMTVCNCKNLYVQPVDYEVNNVNLITILTELIMEKDKIISDLKQEIKKLEMFNTFKLDIGDNTPGKLDQFGR